MGIYLYEGDETPQDSKGACFYLSEAEKAGNALAAYYLGLCYYYGQGVQVSDERAHKLFERAAKGGIKEAEKALETLPFSERDVEFRELQGDVNHGYSTIETLTSRYYDDEMTAYVKSREWYEQAAENGDVQSMVLLARLYSYGWQGAEKNEAKSLSYKAQAYECAKRAFEKDGGNACAKFWLGKCLYCGIGCQMDKVRGKELIKQASDAGYKQAQFNMVGEYIEEDRKLNDSPRLRELLEKLGEDGSPGVKHSVAAYFRDIEFVCDTARSDYWFERSAEEGFVPAQMYLGGEYLKRANNAEWQASRGENAEQNLAVAQEYFKKSFHWFERAVERGFIYSRYDLADFYYVGVATEKDCAKAYELLKPVARCTHGNVKQVWKGAAAARFIGDMYLNGLGVERDENKSFNWYLSAAKRGSPRACTAVGNAYLYGIGIKKDYNLAVNWFEEAVFDYDEQMFNGSDKGYDYNANVGLGDCYRLGLGVAKDEEEAFRLYYDVARYTYDCPAADERTARCYYFGIGVEKDEKEARGYWENAAERGDGDAKKALKQYFNIDV